GCCAEPKMELVTSEPRKPGGVESDFIPVPSPRKMLSSVQNDIREPSDGPDSHHNPKHPTSGVLEGEQHNLTALLQEVDYLRQSNTKVPVIYPNSMITAWMCGIY
ncbi:hypothetical protein GDO81_026623, partial [Engystomops pustulosus]